MPRKAHPPGILYLLILEADTTDRTPPGPGPAARGKEAGRAEVQILPVVAGRTVLTRRPIEAEAGNVAARTGTAVAAPRTHKVIVRAGILETDIACTGSGVGACSLADDACRGDLPTGGAGVEYGLAFFSITRIRMQGTPQLVVPSIRSR